MSVIEFNEMIIKIRQALSAFAYNLTRDREDAQDLVQETYFKAYANRDKFSVGTNVKAWMMTIMKHIFINDYRRNKKRNIMHDPTENLYLINSYASTVPNLAISNFVMQDLNNAVNHLTEDYKKPFLMHSDGYKYEEIAEECALPLGTVKSRIFFARKQMQHFLKQNGFIRYEN